MRDVRTLASDLITIGGLQRDKKARDKIYKAAVQLQLMHAELKRLKRK